MMVVAALLALKSAGLALAGGDAMLAHVHAGLAIYALSHALAIRRAALKALSAVAVAALANEALAAASVGHWSIAVRLAPAVATIFWPAVLFVVAHLRRWRWAEARLRREGQPTPATPAAPTLTIVAGGHCALAPARAAGAAPPRLRVFPGSATQARPG